ncbi:MAG: DUF58 domain-containing protein [Alphaproteobacteria bacterium]|nr:DUF58 domain-containing protein [Alphaproteobacteria bacterium]MCB9692355.1 DUF58 domain-containing protein [Alphaproteobacteria bacterium]
MAFQLIGTFVLPFAVGTLAAAVFEVSEVVETLPALATFTLLLLLPVSLAQILGTVLKSWRELRFHVQRRTLGIGRLFDVLYTHLGVITSRGWSLLFVSLVFVVLSLAGKWASLGMMAVLGLFLFYAVVGWTLLTSTFFVRTFERGLGRAHAGIERQVQPAVCLAGAEAEEVFLFRRVPVPWGYRLLVEDTLPLRLGGESRYVVTSAARDAEIERRGRIRRTPRGIYRLGPARLWYQDVLGITKVSVASLATADMKVLPRIRPVEILEPPRTEHQTPDVRTRPHRFPTEDHFRFKEYVAGDDTRRIHWKLSMRTGAMTVRHPENREITKRDVLLLLDSYVPRYAADAASIAAEGLLDQVVETALGLARTLVDRGDRVRLVTAALTPNLERIAIEEMLVTKGGATRWQDLGARVQWQSEIDVPGLIAEVGEEGHAIVITARFTPVPKSPEGALSTTWVFMDPATAFATDEPHWLRAMLERPAGMWSAIFTRPHPVGSDDNALLRRLGNAFTAWRTWNARAALQRLTRARMGRTAAELASRGDSVYRIEHTGQTVRLRGLVAGRGGLS